MAGGVLAILGVIHKVRHARWVSDRVNVTEYYMGLIDCYASFGVRFNIIRKERESWLYRVSINYVKPAVPCIN